jgi:hypothetical protein
MIASLSAAAVVVSQEGPMKRAACLFIFVVSAAALLSAQGPWSFKGTVTKMRMTDCTMQRGFIASVAGAQPQGTGNCPEYTVVSDKVVYVVVGRRAEDFIPLAENMEFLIRKNELVLISDDEKTKSHFTVQQMVLRAEWDREEARKELAARMMERSVSYEARNPPPGAMSSNNIR